MARRRRDDAQRLQGSVQAVRRRRLDRAAGPASTAVKACPKLLGPTQEMWNAANVGFANGPLLNRGAIEALLSARRLKKRYVPKLVSGEWTGTMNLTEPQAGTDLAQVRTRAEPEGDSTRSAARRFSSRSASTTWRRTSCIWCWRASRCARRHEGHFAVHRPEVSRNRTARSASATTSLRLDRTQTRNQRQPDLHAQYGEKGGAIGELVGEPNRGIEYMFIMMNAARFSVGVQGIGWRTAPIRARSSTRRIACRGATSSPARASARADHQTPRRAPHADGAEGDDRGDARACLRDRGVARPRERHPDEKTRKEHKAFVELMMPVVKGWWTESAIELCSTALQVLAAWATSKRRDRAAVPRRSHHDDLRRYDRDSGARLVGRKLMRDMGATATRVMTKMRQSRTSSPRRRTPIIAIREALGRGSTLNEVSRVGMNQGDLRIAIACSVPYLKLLGRSPAAGRWRAPRKSADEDRRGRSRARILQAKLATANFYATTC